MSGYLYIFGTYIDNCCSPTTEVDLDRVPFSIVKIVSQSQYLSLIAMVTRRHDMQLKFSSNQVTLGNRDVT